MAKRFAIGLISVLGVYVIFAIDRGVSFIKQDSFGVRVLGVGVILIGTLGFYVIFKELRFGSTVAQLAQQADFTGKPDNNTPLTEAQCAELFDDAQSAVAEQPGDWQSWYHLANAYDLNRDRGRAREAMRTAIRLYLNH